MTKASQVDQDLIRTIAELLNKENLAEIEIEQDDFRVRVTRSFAKEMVQVAAPAYAPAPMVAAPQAAVPAGSVPAAAPAVEDLASNPGTLTSPMVGTAYRAAEPGASPFVEVGTKVSEGQTVVIIEAMKTMNQIPAHRSGTVTRILVEDAQPVEYGQPLIVIE
ncbi:acetyl-CoA carboxylase biotin carboxyl carrier protein [Paradevosia shaoguanensis]|jgi:acetyl-CoA carboxylase biotin carboxyl carrier protein|uniref:Biotin carboxyl carrier protein of acetyl-CoA carboxylase n=1 Tax=Paradevosia shaoguanensis TaxID=1335043 RepID=A0AA41QPD4_9HYPH|nr:acetyl-CoA carboxylase biotin carboxyl carrier protein [Paradevosia shaoguanensis]KFL24901.1 acetyl-CoA carboxylase [Devosia sp. 17-2-E-8]MCF1742738.1 acetyl-CoA carboxylase biotin carboxyl carrier protein [Paradevosia shaoguanensis]MCI0127221.1 acetyl-CoA carboxylase biotin carboxyl carrier protein [Paradevosia shaoguanensis]CDP51058.1 Biotin carboxyl carrier protein of acetyl-CoA carb oxylase [Devosia sp. DBB001]